MLNKKDQRLRRSKQTRVRIAAAARRAPDRAPHATCTSTPAVISDDGTPRAGQRLDGRGRPAQGARGRRQGAGKGGNVAAAAAVGKRIAEKAKAAGIEKVAFDRAGFRYHGRVKALADAAREAGLQF